MADLKKYEALFLRNTKDLAQKLQKILKVLSRNSGQPETVLREGQRLAHIIKGSAALMDCKILSNLFVVVEEIFSQALKNHSKIKPQILTEMNQISLEILEVDNFKKFKDNNFQNSIKTLQETIT